MSEESTRAPSAVIWSCDSHHHGQRTSIDDGKIYVPICRTCRDKGRGKRLCNGGTLEYGDAPSAVDAPPQPKRAGKLMDTELWAQFTALLDANRVRMAGGGWSDKWCTRCEGAAHSGPLACQCQCHAAWAFRRAIEGAAEAA